MRAMVAPYWRESASLGREGAAVDGECLLRCPCPRELRSPLASGCPGEPRLRVASGEGLDRPPEVLSRVRGDNVGEEGAVGARPPPDRRVWVDFPWRSGRFMCHGDPGRVDPQDAGYFAAGVF